MRKLSITCLSLCLSFGTALACNDFKSCAEDANGQFPNAKQAYATLALAYAVHELSNKEVESPCENPQ